MKLRLQLGPRLRKLSKMHQSREAMAFSSPARKCGEGK